MQTVSTSSVGLPKVDVSLSADFIFFGRVLAGSENFLQRELGEVAVTTLSPMLSWTARSSTSLGLRLPLGAAVTSPPDRAPSTQFGLGDLKLFVQQDWSRLWRPKGPSWLIVRSRFSVSAPSGMYGAASTLSVTRVAGERDGSIQVSTFDTRASLGAGVWAFLFWTELEAHLSQRLQLSVQGLFAQPSGRTPDEIAWGRDYEAVATGSFDVFPERLTVEAGFDLRHHEADEVPDSDGGPARFSVGGRDEVGLGLGASVRGSERFGCALGAHIPLFQSVGGVQLVESFSGHFGCSMAWALTPEYRGRSRRTTDRSERRRERAWRALVR
jgi:hypothetical protein